MIKALAFFALVALALATHIPVSSRASIPPNWELVSRAPAFESIKLTIALRQRNLDVLSAKYDAATNPDHADYQSWMSVSDILDIVAPPAEDAEAVINYFVKAGATSHKNMRDALEIEMPVFAAEKLFMVEANLYKNTATGETTISHEAELLVDISIASKIDMILGFTEFPFPENAKIKPNHFAPSPNAKSLAIVPQTIFTMYGVPEAGVFNNNYNSSQCAVEFAGQNYAPKDLKKFSSELDVRIDPLDPKHVVGQNNPDESGDESTLDVEYEYGVGLGVDNWFWIETDSNVWVYGWALHFFQTPVVPYINSISYGWNEEMQCEAGIGKPECKHLGVNSAQYVARVNTEFQKVGLRGVTTFVSSGDSGCNGRTDEECTEKHFNPAFPTSSPFVTSVGATEVIDAEYKLAKNPPICSSYKCVSSGTEQCVSDRISGFASGGGFSYIAPLQAWQKDAVNGYLSSGVDLPPSSYYNQTGRAYPDIAAFGNAVLVVEDDEWSLAGGTSASSPIVAAVFGILNANVLKRTGKPLGPINPLLYKMAAEHPAAFNDIVTGNNKCTEYGCAKSCKGFTATKGWDPITGHGTPVYSEMLAYINNMLDARENKF